MENMNHFTWIFSEKKYNITGGLKKLREGIPKGGINGINSHDSNCIRLPYRAHNQVYESKIKVKFKRNRKNKKRKVERNKKEVIE